MADPNQTALKAFIFNSKKIFSLGAGRAFRYKSAPESLRYQVCRLSPSITGAFVCIMKYGFGIELS